MEGVVPGLIKALRLQVFIVSYLQFVEIKYLHAALCLSGYGVGNSGKEPAQVSVPGSYCNTAIEDPNVMGAMCRKMGGGIY